MRTISKLSIIAGLSLASVLPIFGQAQANISMGRDGGGGKVWICSEAGGRQKVYLRDFKIAKYWGVQIEPAAGRNEFEKAKNIINRLSGLDLYRQERYLMALRTFKEQILFVNSASFPDISAVSPYPIDHGCKETMVVNQIVPVEKFAPKKVNRYFIRSEIWKKMDADQRAGLITHEILLADAIDSLGQMTDDKAIVLNTHLNSRALAKNQISLGNYLSILEDTGFGPNLKCETDDGDGKGEKIVAHLNFGSKVRQSGVETSDSRFLNVRIGSGAAMTFEIPASGIHAGEDDNELIANYASKADLQTGLSARLEIDLDGDFDCTGDLGFIDVFDSSKTIAHRLVRCSQDSSTNNRN